MNKKHILIIVLIFILFPMALFSKETDKKLIKSVSIEVEAGGYFRGEWQHNTPYHSSVLIGTGFNFQFSKWFSAGIFMDIGFGENYGSYGFDYNFLYFGLKTIFGDKKNSFAASLSLGLLVPNTPLPSIGFYYRNFYIDILPWFIPIPKIDMDYCIIIKTGYSFSF